MIEPEETLEAKLVALLEAANVVIPVMGALTPAPDGVEKKVPDSYINVKADLASQDMDWSEPSVPCTFSLRVTVSVCRADGKSGALFRDVCRAVRGALASLTGDNCKTLDGDDFRCDCFVLGPTETSVDLSDELGIMSKAYNATVTGRYFPLTETTEQEATNG